MAEKSAKRIELEPTPPGARLGRRGVVIALGTILATLALGMMGVALGQGSWWYPHEADRALDSRSRARVEAIRDQVEAKGTAPEAETWLDTALEPETHPTDVRACLLEAQEILDATGDPKLAEAARELGAVVETMRSITIQTLEFRGTPTPYSPPTLDWEQQDEL